MVKFMKKISKKAGLPPGSLVHIGERKTEEVSIRLVGYGEDRFEERGPCTLQECLSHIDQSVVTWINIDGVHQVDVIEALGSHFNLHPLVLEDILNTDQRPKMDDFEGYLCIILKMLDYSREEATLRMEQVSLVLGPRFVISLHESKGDTFEPVRDRLRKAKGRVRKMGADYLAYSLIDAIVDNYFLVLEGIGEEIEALEEQLMGDPNPVTLRKIHRLKRELILLRKSVWPLREVVSNLEKSESPLVDEKTRVFLKDVFDHTIHIIDTIETFRDMASGMIDVYLSSVSNKMNEIVKVLTMIATIFIPLTFFAGIYGMNFRYMPELAWRWAYPSLWVFLIALALTMVLYFKKKKWF